MSGQKARPSDEAKEDEGRGSPLKVKHDNSSMTLAHELENKNKLLERLNQEMLTKNDTMNKMKSMYEAAKRENEMLRYEQQTLHASVSGLEQLRVQLTDKENQISELVERNNLLTKENEGLSRNIDMLNDDKTSHMDNLHVEIGELKQKISQLEKEKTHSKESYEASFNEIANLEEQLNQVSSMRDYQNDFLQLRASYNALNEQNNQNLNSYRALEEENNALKQSVKFLYRKRITNKHEEKLQKLLDQNEDYNYEIQNLKESIEQLRTEKEENEKNVKIIFRFIVNKIVYARDRITETIK